MFTAILYGTSLFFTTVLYHASSNFWAHFEAGNRLAAEALVLADTAAEESAESKREAATAAEDESGATALQEEADAYRERANVDRERSGIMQADIDADKAALVKDETLLEAAEARVAADEVIVNEDIAAAAAAEAAVAEDEAATDADEVAMTLGVSVPGIGEVADVIGAVVDSVLHVDEAAEAALAVEKEAELASAKLDGAEESGTAVSEDGKVAADSRREKEAEEEQGVLRSRAQEEQVKADADDDASLEKRAEAEAKDEAAVGAHAQAEEEEALAEKKQKDMAEEYMSSILWAFVVLALAPIVASVMCARMMWRLWSTWRYSGPHAVNHLCAPVIRGGRALVGTFRPVHERRQHLIAPLLAQDNDVWSSHTRAWQSYYWSRLCMGACQLGVLVLVCERVGTVRDHLNDAHHTGTRSRVVGITVLLGATTLACAMWMLHSIVLVRTLYTARAREGKSHALGARIVIVMWYARACAQELVMSLITVSLVCVAVAWFPALRNSVVAVIYGACGGKFGVIMIVGASMIVAAVIHGMHGHILWAHVFQSAPPHTASDSAKTVLPPENYVSVSVKNDEQSVATEARVYKSWSYFTSKAAMLAHVVRSGVYYVARVVRSVVRFVAKVCAIPVELWMLLITVRILTSLWPVMWRLEKLWGSALWSFL